MSWRHLHGRAEVDTQNPQPFAICDRCSLQWNLNDLRWQFDQRGAQIRNIQLLVCRFCVDVPATFTTPQILPPDPVGLADTRPEFYDIDETDFRITEEEDTRITEGDEFRVLDSSSTEGTE